MEAIKIRPIQHKDNAAVASIVREVLMEMGAPKVGTAYEDVTLDTRYEVYQDQDSGYFVLEENDKIIGGGGIAKLQGGDTGVCELKKMYFLPEARGRGLGLEMISKCLEFAKQIGYTSCYLETMPYMEAARGLYAKVGFKPLEGPMGDTGHHSCQTWMIKEL